MAVRVTLPLAADERFKNQTSPVAPLRHFWLELVMLVVWLNELVPYLAVLALRPLETVQPANVYPLFVGAETLNAVPYVALVGFDEPAVPPLRAYVKEYVELVCALPSW